MNIHEYQAKELLKHYGVNVPMGYPAFSPDEVESVAKEIMTKKIVVKAQIHAGGRGKAGGVKLVDTPEEAKIFANTIFEKKLITPQTGSEGQEVKRLYVEEASVIKQELYLSAIVDREGACITFIASVAGGMDIEEVAEQSPEKIKKAHVKLSTGFAAFQGRRLGFEMGLKKEQIVQFVDVMRGIYNLLVYTDASQVEINPLAIVEKSSDGEEGEEIIALDAKINFDANALFRNPSIESLRDLHEENPLERQAESHGLSYVPMDGVIGCLVNGAGLAMATMDKIQYEGASPANFLDVGGGATQARVEQALGMILSDKAVKAVLVNIFGGIVRCDVVADAIIAAVGNMGISVPLVVRLSGTNSDIGNRKLSESGLSIITANDLGEAARKVVAAV